MRNQTNKEVMDYLLAPILFLTVALGGGLRFEVQSNAILFLRPSLISCIIGLLTMILLARQGLIRGVDYFGEHRGFTGNISGAIRIVAIYCATVQVFNLVTPERGFLSFTFNLFYLLILLNNLFVMFNPRRLAGSLATLLGASFLLKYVLLADLFAPTESWGKYILQELMKAGSLGALDYQAFAAATGYLAFFTVTLYGLGLYLIAPSAGEWESQAYQMLNAYRLPFDHERPLAAVPIRERLAAVVGRDVDEIGSDRRLP